MVLEFVGGSVQEESGKDEVGEGSVEGSSFDEVRKLSQPGGRRQTDEDDSRSVEGGNKVSEGREVVASGRREIFQTPFKRDPFLFKG